MANVMTLDNVKNNVHRSGFDLSFRNLFTSKTGEVLPVGVVETIPGDKFTINMSNFMRTMPFETASFARLRHYVDVYFVPNRLLWDKFPAWIMQTKNQYFAASPTEAAGGFGSQPYVLASDIAAYLTSIQKATSSTISKVDDAGQDRVLTTIKLLSYLGYGEYTINSTGSVVPPGSPSQPVNLFPLLAYQKIYQDHFRFSQWEEAAPWTYNLDYVLTSNSLHILPQSSKLNTVSNMFDMRYCNYDKDLFNGLLPSAQYGDTSIASPLSGTLSGNLSMSLYSDSGTGATSNPVGFNSRTGGLSTSQSAILESVNQASFTPSSDTTLGLSVLTLRFAEALQKWKEITLSGSSDYKEQLYKHWNVRISDYASDRCRYVGGMAENINISEVVNQNLAETGSDANLAGKGALAQNGKLSFSTDEYGLLIFVSHVKPIIEWNANKVSHPLMYRFKATDYAIPEFDNLGLQSLSARLLRGISGSSDGAVLGYAPRYIDYKTSYDRVCGAFLSMPQWTLIHQPSLNSQGKVGPNFFRISPTVTDDLFLARATEDSSVMSDPYYHSLMLDIKVARNLSYDGMPY